MRIRPSYPTFQLLPWDWVQLKYSSDVFLSSILGKQEAQSQHGKQSSVKTWRRRAGCFPTPMGDLAGILLAHILFFPPVSTQKAAKRMWGIWESLDPWVGIKLDVRKRVFSGVQFQCSCGSHWALLWVPFHLRSSVTCRFKGENLAAIFLEIALFKPCIFCWVPHKHKAVQPGTEWNIQPFHSPAVFPGCLAYGSTRYACQ